MKHLLFIILCFVLLSCKAQEKIKIVDVEKSNFKKYVLCQCMYKGVPIKDSLLRAEGSAGMYVQMGNYEIEHYEKAIGFIDEYLKKAKAKYKSKVNANLTIAKCIDLYESKELDIFIKDLKEP